MLYLGNIKIYEQGSTSFINYCIKKPTIKWVFYKFKGNYFFSAAAASLTRLKVLLTSRCQLPSETMCE